MLYLNGDDIILDCHSEAQRRISSIVLTMTGEIPHFVANYIFTFVCHSEAQRRISSIVLAMTGEIPHFVSE